jgi:hypothetical protein
MKFPGSSNAPSGNGRGFFWISLTKHFLPARILGSFAQKELFMATGLISSSGRDTSSKIDGYDDSLNEGGPSNSTASNPTNEAASGVLNRDTQNNGSSYKSQDSSSSRNTFIVMEHEDTPREPGHAGPKSCCGKTKDCFSALLSW